MSKNLRTSGPNEHYDSALLFLEGNQLVAMQVSTGSKKPLLKIPSAQSQLSNALITY